MPEYLAPAVYVEEVSFRAPSIEGVGTTTTGFAGPALTGPIDGTPELLTSFGDYQSTYGGFDDLSLPVGADSRNYLALSVKAFFDNGGSRLYVARVFSPGTGDGKASAQVGAVTVSARFPGAFANDQMVTASLVATKTTAANLAALPPGSLVASFIPGPTAPRALAAPVVDLTGTSITLTQAITGPAFVLIDGEIMKVHSTASGTTVTVDRAQFDTSAALHGLGSQVFDPIGTINGSAVIAPGAISITLGSPPTGGTPAAVRIGSEVLSVSTLNNNDTLMTSSTTAQHTAGDPVFGTTLLTYHTNGSSTTFPNLSPLPPSASLYVLTITVSAFGAASAKVSAPTSQPALVYAGLGFDSLHPNYLGATLGEPPPRHIDALQNQIAFTIGTGANTPTGLRTALFGTWGGPGTTASQTFTLAGGNDGGEPQSGDYDAALTRLDALEDIAIVAAPGSSAFADRQAIMGALITHVSKPRAYRIAILDAPRDGLASDYENVRAQIDSSYAAFYAPWVKMANPLARAGTAIPAQVYVPPSGFIAGIYARSDSNTSVAKAPANEVVLGALDFERRITFAEQGVLNPLGINCLRYLPDRGYRVWGARTASSDSEFKYVNVRRYLIYLEHSIDNSTQWAVFENNGPALWARVKDSIDSFLNNEFVEGRLLGTSPSTAYFVRCDRTTMTQNDLDNGRMVCLIGVSVLKPAEFVIFRIGQWTAAARS